MVMVCFSQLKKHPFMVKSIIVSLLICLSTLGYSQDDDSAKIIDWKFLSHVDYEDKYYPEWEAWYLVPKFDESILAIDGHRIIIKGYIIPLDAEGGVFALSAYPFSACFFCGGAGPESVMSLKFKSKPKKYSTDDVIMLTGTLKLNSTDFEDFNYILQEVEEINP